MRLFPGDDVPGLAALAQEMPAPWLMPWGLSRRHRDRLGAMVVRAVRAFDPRVRCVQLRWVEAPLVRDERIVLPERVLVWWRSDTMVEEPATVLREAPRLARGFHLLDLDGTGLSDFRPARNSAAGLTWRGKGTGGLYQRLADGGLAQRRRIGLLLVQSAGVDPHARNASRGDIERTLIDDAQPAIARREKADGVATVHDDRVRR